MVTFVASAAYADELRVHAGAGAAQAVGGAQQRELGTGGGGHAAIEWSFAKAVGAQAGVAAVALPTAAAPADAGIAPRSTGTAVLGTLGVRVHPFSGSQTRGVWIDANGALARTGDAMRPAFDAHIGWSFRPTRDSHWDVGPFFGYTHVVEPDGGIRPDDARIAWAGFAISFGSRDEKPAPDPSAMEPSPLLPARPVPPPQPIAQEDEDGDVEVVDKCPEGDAEDGCKAIEFKLLADRIQLDDVIHFETGIGRVKSKSHWLLFRLAKFINKHPEILEVSVEGHADAVGDVDFNQELSEARATSTRKFLVKFGVAPERIKVIGHGMAQLRVPTLGSEERNRRVELWVKRGVQ
jgi:outer membrane protein OmpA-like peptidoglycan-associated protein